MYIIRGISCEIALCHVLMIDILIRSLGSEISEKENSYTSIVPYPPVHASPDKSKIISDDFISRRSPARRQALARLDVNSPIKVLACKCFAENGL